MLVRTSTIALALLVGLAATWTAAAQRREPLTTQPITDPAAPAWHNSSWLNTPNGKALTLADLKGRVVLLNFWTFTCYNCTNTVPSLVLLDQQYRDRGLTVIGIQSPEFPPYGGEHDKGNVADALHKYHIDYPVAQDNDHATWNLYDIQAWPSFVLIDKQGKIRYRGAGEFHTDDRWYQAWNDRIVKLLAE
jgi:cytochrome oxidase Cu insertion factor (SCO1/SenC/PrrC family)